MVKHTNSRKKVLPNLPTEVIDEILFRLPIQTLCRFKVVSHAWSTRISSTYFAKSCNAYLKSYKKLILYNGWSIYSVPIYDNSLMYALSLSYAEEVASEEVKHDFDHGFILLTSCNGLLLVYEHEKHRLCIWNPTSGECKEVPIIPEAREIFPVWTSFGCVSSHEENYDKYKVFYSSSYGKKICWYSMCTNSWGEIRDLPYSSKANSGGMVLVNSKFHCFASTHANNTVILAFDIEDEEFKEVSQPGYGVGGFGVCMAELNGNLCLTSRKNRTSGMCFWVLKEYGVEESWANMLFINYENIRSPWGTCYYASPLHVSEDGQFLLHTWFNRTGNVIDKITFYNSRNHEDRTLAIDGIPDRFWTKTCVETLVSPNRLGC